MISLKLRLAHGESSAVWYLLWHTLQPLQLCISIKITE
jgi:hypothetical protein